MYAGVCSVVVEGPQRTGAALLTVPPTVLWERQGGALLLAGGDAGTVLHGGRTGDHCKHKILLFVVVVVNFCQLSAENSPQSDTRDRKSIMTENLRQWRA